MTRWIVVGLVAITAACSGGGSPAVVIPAISAAFTAMPSNPGANSAAMAPASGTKAEAVLPGCAVLSCHCRLSVSGMGGCSRR